MASAPPFDGDFPQLKSARWSLQIVKAVFAVAEALVACRRPCGMGTTAYRSRGEHDDPASYLNYTGNRLQDVTAPMAFRQLKWGFGSWKLASAYRGNHRFDLGTSDGCVFAGQRFPVEETFTL
jgi:hypothetical protein